MIRTRSELKGFFKKNQIPTQGNFEDLIDSALSLNDDGIAKLPNDPLTIQGVGTDENVLRFSRADATGSKPTWTIKQKPEGGASTGLAFQDASGIVSLFLESGTGYAGIGTAKPTAKLHVSGGDIQLDGNQQVRFTDTDSSNRLKLQLWSGYGLGINANTLFYAAYGRHSWRDYDGTNERMFLNTAPDGGLSVLGTGVSSFAGNVGIGTSTPTVKLDVNGDTHLAGKLGINGDVLFGGGRSISVAAAAEQGQGGDTLRILAGSVKGGGGGAAFGGSLILQAGAGYASWSTWGGGHVVLRSGPNLTGSQNFADLVFQTGGATADEFIERMRIKNDGIVGIGTNNPTEARLVVRGGGRATHLDTFRYMSATDLSVSGPQNRDDIGIYCEQALAAREFWAFSDGRAKSVLGQSNGERDLAALLLIQITDYNLKDAGQETRAQKKVVAQQVETVFPQAVSQQKGAVPDIYQEAAVKHGWVKVATNLKRGERVRLIGAKKDDIYEVLEVAEDCFRTDFAGDGDMVFVYGREVNDFRTVDYDAIAMLNVSATQELYRRIEEQAAGISARDRQIAELEQRVATLADNMRGSDERVRAIEAMLANMNSPTELSRAA